MQTPPKLIAFVLPQFHAIPENDEWWGKGFTEWTNVRKAQPLFPGHMQPRIPANGRYYDLLDPATQDWQAALAREHGIHGFCYYHYWFKGRRLLEKPVELLLQRGKPELPFCLSWANEPWTRAWDGSENRVLMPQAYGDESDWAEHFEYLLRVFRDPRYIRVGGKPMFLFYRGLSIPVLEPMLALWRKLAERAGLPGLHLVSMRTAFPIDRRPIFDAYADFEPLYSFIHERPWVFRKRERWVRRFTLLSWYLFGSAKRAPNSYDYSLLWNVVTRRPLPERTYPGIFVDWDNSPRRGLKKGHKILRNFNPTAFEKGVRAQLRKAQAAGAEFMFINAWNEWAEGAYLEPDEARGTFFLDSIRDALEELEAVPAAEAAAGIEDPRLSSERSGTSQPF